MIKYNAEYMEAHAASNVAYELRDLIAVTYCTFENEGSGIDFDKRGIGGTLERAEKLACDVIDLCEKLEAKVKREAANETAA